MRLIASLALAAMLAETQQQCGPTPRDVGVHVLLAGPVMVLVVSLLLWLLARLWRRAVPALRVDWRPTFAVGGAVTLLALIALAVGGFAKDVQLGLSLWWVVLVLVGAAYASLVCATWRLWARWRPAAAFTWVQVPAAVLFLTPAVVLLFDLSPEAGRALYDVYDGLALAVTNVWPGIIVLVLAALLEAALRARRASVRPAAGAAS